MRVRRSKSSARAGNSFFLFLLGRRSVKLSLSAALPLPWSEERSRTPPGSRAPEGPWNVP